MNVLLVDDEMTTRSYFRGLIDWEGLGYRLLEADSGAAAMERMKAQRIHLVLLDITMPGISGLEVLQWVRSNCPKAIVTLLTNHDEFIYAQQALKIGCFDYVLKSTLDEGALTQLIQRMQEQLSQAEQEQHRLTILKTEAARKAKRELRDNINYWLLSPQVPFRTVRDRMLEALGGEEARSRYLLLELSISDYDAVIRRYTENNIVQFIQVFDGVLAELLEDIPFLCTAPTPGRFLLWLRFSRLESTQKILNQVQALANRMESSLRNILGIRASLTYTLPFSQLEAGKQEYISLAQLHRQQFFHPREEVFCLQDYITDPAACKAFLESFEAEFGKRISSRNLLDVEIFYDDMVRKIAEQHYCIDPDVFIRLCEYLLSATLSDWTLGKNRLHGPRNFDNCQALKKNILDTLKPFCLSDQDQDKNLLIKKALLLIQQNYASDIGLEWLADQLWVNASYLSRIFSQEVGQPFTTYLNKYRIEQAKHLIATTNLKLYEIAEQSGFSSAIVFSGNFKKVTGMSPSEYRNTLPPQTPAE